MAENKMPFQDSKRVRQFIIIAAIIAAVLIVLGVLLAGRVFDWNRSQKKHYLIDIVNEEYPIDADWSPEFTLIENGQLVCSDCVSALEVMLYNCKANGGDPVILSAYRSESAQQRLLDSIAEDYISQGMDSEEAMRQAVAGAASPGCNEHQLGYAVDIMYDGYEYGFEENDPTLVWLKENSWKYGFILRNIYSCSEDMNSDLHPYHFRYVGEEAASQINELNITLEEYVQMFYSK